MYGDYIAYDCWLGKVYDLKNQVILKLSNGARYFFLLNTLPLKFRDPDLF